MINEELELFLKFDFPDSVREKFYPDLIEYFDFIIPLLKKGKHTKNNEMDGVGSQYLYLYYVDLDKSTTAVVARNEQGKDVVFHVSKNSSSKSVEVFIAHSTNGLEKVIPKSSKYKKTKEGFTLNFKNVEDLKKFITNNQDLAAVNNSTSELIKKEKPDPSEANLSVTELVEKMLKDSKKSKPRPKALFEVKVYSDGKVFVSTDSQITLTQELRIFDLMNTLLCGVSDNANVPFPKKLFNKEIEPFVKKLKEALPKSAGHFV